MRLGSFVQQVPTSGSSKPGTNGPFAEGSRIAGDTREMVARVYGVERAGSVTYQSAQTDVAGVPLRLFVVGFELGRPGGPRAIIAGREILRSRYEMIADNSSGLKLGDEVPLGTRGHKFTVVGLNSWATRSRRPGTLSHTSRCAMLRRSSLSWRHLWRGARPHAAALRRAAISLMPSSPRCRRTLRRPMSLRQWPGGSIWPRY